MIFASRAPRTLGATLLVCGHSPNPPESRFHSELRINKVDADRFFYKQERGATPLY